MRNTHWQKLFTCLLLMIFIGQSSIALATPCPMLTPSISQENVPPCHQKTNAKPDMSPTAAPDCCIYPGHCLSSAAALIDSTLRFTPLATSAADYDDYHRQHPGPHKPPLFRPPIST